MSTFITNQPDRPLTTDKDALRDRWAREGRLTCPEVSFPSVTITRFTVPPVDICRFLGVPGTFTVSYVRINAGGEVEIEVRAD